MKREEENLLWNYVCEMEDNIKMEIAKKKNWMGRYRLDSCACAL